MSNLWSNSWTWKYLSRTFRAYSTNGNVGYSVKKGGFFFNYGRHTWDKLNSFCNYDPQMWV